MDPDDHPLLRELASLRQTAARFQHEAHTAAIKLQRHSLEASCLHELAASVEQENARLAHELEVLRAHPETPPHPAVEQAQELTLALRRVSEKMVLVEGTLLQRTSELVDARSELARAKNAADGAYELAARMRAREEAAKARARELEFKARASEEERRMVDLVVQEYADLVRTLEGRKSPNPPILNGSASTITLVDGLQEGKSSLRKSLTVFSTESEQLHATIAELNDKVSDLQLTLDAERATAAADRASLSHTKTELDKLRLEDQTAAKMVAHYMKFSQTTTNGLQQQITTLKTRHASTISTFDLQLSIAESQLASERGRAGRLQDALDELCEDLARESYGRRREIALRLALLSREETVAEFMRRWVRRARELYARCYDSVEAPPPHVSSRDAFHRVVSDAESLLSTLDDDVQLSDTIRASGSLARIVLSREAVETLRLELQDELQKRAEAVRKCALSVPIEDLSQPKGTPLSESDARRSQLLLTLDENADLDVSPVTLSPSVSAVGGQDPTDDPFTVPAIATSPIADDVIVPAEIPFVQDSFSTSATHPVGEPKAHSQAVSTSDQPSLTAPPNDPMPTPDGPPNASVPDAPESDRNVLTDVAPSTPVTIVQNEQVFEPPTAVLVQPSPPNSHPALLSELGTTKDRYDALRRAFRDCSLALKELKHNLASSSPSLYDQLKLRHQLDTVLARIDDYIEDARVELEIRIADEELTARGLETMLSVPGALHDADERAEVEASAREFVDGTDPDVARALERFGKKLEDVQHDVAVVKRVVHGFGPPDGDDEGARDEGVDGSRDAAGWTAWTAGLLGANATPTRSPTPVQTFGAVMTSPRLRPATSPGADGEPLAGLDLRIAMPLPARSSRAPLGLGRAMGAPTRPRTLSTMYAVGGLRSASSVGLGVGLGGSSARTRLEGSSLRGGVHDLGDVE